MSDYKERIKRGLILYLREVHDIKAVDAELGLTEFEAGQYEGCETCGYGSDDDKVWTPLRYKEEGDRYWNTIELDTTTLDLFPTLLPYIDRAN